MNKTRNGQPSCPKMYEKTEIGSRYRSVFPVTIVVKSSYVRSECYFGYRNQPTTTPQRRKRGEQESQLTNTPCTHGIHEGLSSIHIGMFRYRHALVSF